MTENSTKFIAACAPGIEPLLEQELLALGATQAKALKQRVEFSGDNDIVYKALLWSRLASRVLLPIKTIPALNVEQLQTGLRGIAWDEYFDISSSIAIDVTGKNPQLHHSHFAALASKDAIVDFFRDKYDDRPSVDTAFPDVRIHVHINRETAEVSLNLSGESLHKRGYRKEGAKAPLTETLAAAVVIRAGWPEMLKAQQESGEEIELLDPMCGSGTLVIEAALMAADIAPALQRVYWGFEGWLDHRPAVWKKLMADAEERAASGIDKLKNIRFTGSDNDKLAIMAAQSNVQRAGVADYVQFAPKNMQQTEPTAKRGLLIVNPPYGERLGEAAELAQLYSALGNHLKRNFVGWRAAVITGDIALGQRLGLRAERKYTLFNGALKCVLLPFELHEQTDSKPSAGAVEFTNRLKKNLKHLNRWAKRNEVSNYRVYDADLPDYSLAIDLYHDVQKNRWVHVQEYQAPATIDPIKAERRLREALQVIEDVLEVEGAQVTLKQRARQRGTQQYEKQSVYGRKDHLVDDGGVKVLVNFTNYLDTGLFLDHRPVRQKIRQLAAGKKFLNLFCYTGTATIHAIAGGAKETTSVDMSGPYLTWAERNVAANSFQNPKHTFIQADCLTWLEKASEDKSQHGQYDLIFLDPPTFSNSKRMDDTFDVQRDQEQLIEQTMLLLAKDGLLIFSNNQRRFKLAEPLQKSFACSEITAKTIDEDFKRSKNIHKCWEIQHLS